MVVVVVVVVVVIKLLVVGVCGRVIVIEVVVMRVVVVAVVGVVLIIAGGKLSLFGVIVCELWWFIKSTSKTNYTNFVMCW